MHELSIAHSLVELASSAPGIDDASHVKSVNLVVGALSCVSPGALEFCFELAAEGSPLEGAELRIRRVPVVIFCPACDEEVELPGIQSFMCPRCQVSSNDVRQGRELEIESLVVEVPDEVSPTAEVESAETNKLVA